MSDPAKSAAPSEEWPEEKTPVQELHGHIDPAEADRLLLKTEIESAMARAAEVYAMVARRQADRAAFNADIVKRMSSIYADVQKRAESDAQFDREVLSTVQTLSSTMSRIDEKLK